MYTLLYYKNNSLLAEAECSFFFCDLSLNGAWYRKSIIQSRRLKFNLSFLKVTHRAHFRKRKLYRKAQVSF